MTRPSKSLLEKAVHQQRVYMGAERASIRDQQRLHTQLMRTLQRIAEVSGLAVADVAEQVAKEAQKRGPITAWAGKDY